MHTEIDEAAHADTPGAAHFVRFYREDARLLEEVADFIDVALRGGGTGIIIATGEHIAELNQRVAGLGSMEGKHGWFPGDLVTVDADEALAHFMVDGWPDEKRFDDSVGKLVRTACSKGNAVHAFGEMVMLLCQQGLYDAAVRLEQMWNGLRDQCSFSLFCAYPWHLFPTEELAAAFQSICGEHDHVRSHSHAPADMNQQDVHLRMAELEQKSLALNAEVARRKESEQTLRRREKEFADFVENAAEGLHRVGPDGVILWANKAELKMLGYRWEEYVGHHIAEFHADRPVIDSILARLNRGETLYDQPARMRCKDGSIKHVVIHSNACFEDGQLRYTRCFMRDATERQELEKAHIEREAMVAELGRANRAKDEFLAMLGHELRNPLAPIVMALELIQLRGDKTARREHQIIRRHVDHLVRLVDDLLDISRITRGKIEMRIERTDISSILSKAVEMCSPLLEQRRHRLSLDIEHGLYLEADPMRLAQVVANLINNAARYTDSGGHVSVAAARDVDDTLKISVKDNGIGIPPERLPHIFDLFFQGERGADRAEGGLGIGLALVRNIVELHGGSVRAESGGKGKGSEFIVRMPMSSGLEKPVRPEHSAAMHAAPGLCKRRVMLVDDNVDAAATLAQVLAVYGHEVEVFNDPVTALTQVQRFKPEIAVLDIGLPVLDGYELAGRIRSLLGELPCRLIALSGYGQDADKTRSDAAGFEQHLVKPVSLSQLVRLIANPPLQ